MSHMMEASGDSHSVRLVASEVRRLREVRTILMEQRPRPELVPPSVPTAAVSASCSPLSAGTIFSGTSTTSHVPSTRRMASRSTAHPTIATGYAAAAWSRQGREGMLAQRRLTVCPTIRVCLTIRASEIAMTSLTRRSVSHTVED